MLPKSRRLTRQEFIKVKNQGQNYSFPHFSAILLKQPGSKFSIVTSAKFHPHAVIRNRFRREVYRIFSSFSPHCWLIFYPKPSMLKLTHDQISSLFNSSLSPLLVP